MDNATRRQLLMRHRQSGYPGSILDVFKAYDMGIDLLGQFEQQNNMQVARTPQQQQQGLRPAHQAGNVNQSMAFPNVPPNTPFNTMGMKAPIDIKKFDEQGHLVKSYDNVPPGVQSLPTGPQRGTVIETPANMQLGGALQVPKMFINQTKQRIADNVFPSGYVAESLNKVPAKRIYDTVIKNEPEPGSRASGAIDRDSLEERKNLLAYAMGQSDDLPAAEYKPTNAKNPDAEYFRSPVTEKNLRQELSQSKDPLKYIEDHAGRVGYHAGVNDNVLGNYTVTKGEGDQGSYLSYYDEYDFDPFTGKVATAISSAAQALAGVRAPELYGRIYYNPETGRPIEQKQSGGNYNMARAQELGYKPDATGHYPSVDHKTGMLLKSKEHPTVKLEFMSQMLSPERKMIANPTGYFGENQLQYVPRKMQTGGTFPQQGPDGIVVPATPPNTAQATRPQPQQPGPRFEDTMEWIGEQYGPDQFGDTLNLTALDLVSEHRQGILQPHAVRDTIAYHETGPHQRMQPNAIQITNRGGQGVGRGMYMYDQPSTLTAANRVDSISSYMGLETPQFITDLQDSSGTSRADTLSREQQDMLFMGDLIEGPAPGMAYGAGETDIETLWYRGHNRRPDEQAAREEFRESMRGLEQDNLRNYMFLEDRPNYFERRQRRRGGPMRKYFRLRK